MIGMRTIEIFSISNWLIVQIWICTVCSKAFLNAADNSENPKKEETPPNFLIFMVDDLGIGDIGCYGNTTIKTPNVDSIARKGIKFEHNLAAESVCTPSRAAFLTGRYAIRSGMAGKEGVSRVFVDTAIHGGLPSNETTFAKILQNIGYETALLGKWHLGLSCKGNDFCHHPNNHGFTYFYGMPATNLRNCGTDGEAITMRSNLRKYLLFSGLPNFLALILLLFVIKRLNFYSVILVLSIIIGFYHLKPIIDAFRIRRFTCILMRQKEVVEQPIILKNMTQKFVSEAIHFIQQNKQKPFLLFVSFLKVHTALFTTKMFSQNSKHGQYGDNVEEMDWAVGRILREIAIANLQNNTFVYFTSDHGPDLKETVSTGEYHGGSKGKLKGGKASSWEGGIRVPTVAMWPGKIPENTIIDRPTSSLDMFPTIIKMAKSEVPNDRFIDGIDMTDMLVGKDANEYDRFFFHYCAESIHAITYNDAKRSKVWKIHLRTHKWLPGTELCSRKSICSCYGNDVTEHDPPLVYELKSDPGEKFPLNLTADTNESMLKNVLLAINHHMRSIDNVPNQLEMTNFLPWMQMCCNFPICTCIEQFPRQLIEMQKTTTQEWK